MKTKKGAQIIELALRTRLRRKGEAVRCVRAIRIVTSFQSAHTPSIHPSKRRPTNHRKHHTRYFLPPNWTLESMRSLLIGLRRRVVHLASDATRK